MMYGDKVAEETRRKLVERARKDTETTVYFSTVDLVLNPAHLEAMLIPALNDQLELHHRLSIETDILKKTHFKRKRHRYLVFQMLVERHNARSRGEAVDADAMIFADLGEFSLYECHTLLALSTSAY
jgi:hypothetical protein